MSGLYHTPKAFGRWIEVDRRMKDITTENYACPYCPESAPTFKTRNVLFKHIENSKPANSSTDHDHAKRNDGCMTLDWPETPGETVNKKRRVKRQANDRKLFEHRTGFVCSEKRALEQAILDPGNKLFVLGGPAPESSAKLMKFAEDYDVAEALVITERSQKFSEDCDLWDAQTAAVSDLALAYMEDDNTIE